MVFEIVENLINLLEVFGLFMLLRSKLILDRTRIPAAIVGMFIVSGLTTLANKLGLDYAILLLLALTEHILYSVIIFKGLLKKRILWGAAEAIIICVTNGMVFLIFTLFSGSVQLLSPTWQRVIMNTAYVALLSAVTYTAVKYDESTRVFPKAVDSIVISLCIVGGVGLYRMLTEITYLSSHGLDTTGSIIPAVIFIIFIISLILLLDFLGRVTKKQVDAESELAVMNSRAEYESRIMAMTDTFRRIKHDYANHMSAVTAYVKNDDMASLRRYMDDYNSKYSVDTVFLTGNAVLDTILTQKAMICEHEGIEFHFSAEIGRKIPLTDLEITSLIGNLLDNAIEAQNDVCVKKYINLKIMTIEQMFIIQAENSSAGNYLYDGDRLITSKKDRGLHGFGLKIMNEVTDSHKGVMAVSPEPTRFVIEIYIQI